MTSNGRELCAVLTIITPRAVSSGLVLGMLRRLTRPWSASLPEGAERTQGQPQVKQGAQPLLSGAEYQDLQTCHPFMAVSCMFMYYEIAGVSRKIPMDGAFHCCCLCALQASPRL